MSRKPEFRLSFDMVDWWPVATGFLVLYVPTYLMLAREPWTMDEYAHGPLILAVVLWLVWRKRNALANVASTPSPRTGGILLLLGLMLYVIGRSQDILIFEVGSQIPVLTGIILILIGGMAARILWFPVLFLVFLVPLPGVFIDALTGPLKQQVSIIVDELLYRAGYPIARDGVVLTIGSYQMLIADACSGLNSMFSLSALGLLYIYLRGHAGWLRNGLLVISILPVAFIANIGRVSGLVLITYYLGDEAGQGFLHDFAALAEFIIALFCLIALDGVLALILREPAGRVS